MTAAARIRPIIVPPSRWSGSSNIPRRRPGSRRSRRRWIEHRRRCAPKCSIRLGKPGCLPAIRCGPTRLRVRRSPYYRTIPTCSSTGYLDKAVTDLDRVLKTDPRRVDALIYRASVNRALNRLDPALADVEKALAQVPGSVPALLERGNIRRLKGDLMGARQD